MKRRLLILLPNAFFSPLIATPTSAQQGLNGVLRYAGGSPVPDSKITLEDFFRFADRFGQ
jgi:hypothetical protein